MRLRIALMSGRGRSWQLTAERLVNMYAEQAPDESLSPIVLHACPGLVSLADFSTIGGAGPIRELHVMGTNLYSVAGSTLYSGVTPITGTVGGSGPVMAVDDGTYMMLTTNPDAFTLTGTTLAIISDGDFVDVSSGTYLNGYFVSSELNTDTFVWSAIGNPTSYDALDFLSAEANGDQILRIIADHQQLWAFGRETCEIYQVVADDPPFSRVPGGVNELGIAGAFSACIADNAIFWVDKFGVTRRSSGYDGMRVSTHAIEYRMAQGTISGSRLFSYVQEGHTFIVANVPGAGTFVFDAATQLWHERLTEGHGRWRVDCYARVGTSTHYAGDYQSANVWQLDLDTTDDDHVAEIVFPPIQNDGKRFRVRKVQLDMEMVKNASPQVMLQTSPDGSTWSNELWQPYNERVIWRNLGQYYNCHLKFRISDAYRRVVWAAYAEIE